MNTMKTTTEAENISKYQTEVTKLKNTINELMNTIKRFEGRLDEAEKSIGELKDREVEFI